LIWQSPVSAAAWQQIRSKRKKANLMTRVSTTGTYHIPGVYEPIEYVVETHTVCDECGSSDIGYQRSSHLPAPVVGGFSLVIGLCFYGGVVTALGEMLSGVFKYNQIIWGLWIISAVTFTAFCCLSAFVERNNAKNPKCNTCGNEHIT
jgi:hypothetical protein